MADTIELVRPSLPLLPRSIELPPFDQLTRTTFSLIFAFSLPMSCDEEDVLSALREGLQATSDEIPFLTANVVMDDMVRDSVQLDISDTASDGIRFHVRHIPSLEWKDLERRGFPTAQLRNDQLAPEPLPTKDSMPVLTVHVNFISGGMLLGLNFSHTVFDGRSVLTFMTRWASHTCLASRGQSMASEDKLPRTSFDRSTLFRGHCNIPLSEFPYYNLDKRLENLPPLSVDFTDWYHGNLLSKKRKLSDSNIIGSIWQFTDTSFNELRRLVCGTQPCEFSLNTLMSAFLWQRIAKARQPHKRGEKVLGLCFPVDVRDMITPPLSATYIGNCLLMARATIEAASMENYGPEFLSTLAECITNARNWVTPDRVQAWIGGINASPDIRRTLVHLDMRSEWFLGTEMLVSNTSSNDFAMEWGPDIGSIKAVRLCPRIAGLDEGSMLVFPPVGGRPVECVTYLTSEAVQRLDDDEVWAKMMTLVCSEQIA